jgi:hypothetical protein
MVLLRDRGTALSLLVNSTHGIDRIGLVRTFVSGVSFDSRKAQGEATRVLGAGLHFIEGNFHHQLRAHIHGIVVTAELDGLEVFGLPGKYLGGQALEGFAERESVRRRIRTFRSRGVGSLSTKNVDIHGADP